MTRVGCRRAIICTAIAISILSSSKAQNQQNKPGFSEPFSQNAPRDSQGGESPPTQLASSSADRDQGEFGGPGPPVPGTQAPIIQNERSEPNAVETEQGSAPRGDQPADSTQSQGLPGSQGAGFSGAPSQSSVGLGANSASGSSVPNAATASAGASLQAGGRGAEPAGSAEGQAGSALQKLTEFRSRHRKTIDGRLCAAAFVHEGQTYTDCTDARSPNGSSGREWCYVEVQLLGKGPTDWEFCVPPLNYNALRAFVWKELDALMATNDEMIESLDAEELRLQDMLSRYQQTCGPSHAALKETFGQIESRLSRGTQCLKRLEISLNEVGLIESAIEGVRADIEREGGESLKEPENCLVQPGYEDDPMPDGLRAAYFANSHFVFPPAKYRNDRKIDFLFFGDGPIEDVPAHAYSIRWDGFLLAPHSGPYVFTTETDCGVRVFLNSKSIIVDRMPPATEDNAFGYKSVPLVATEERSGVHRQDSHKVELIAGDKYRIRIELVHSNHLKYKSPDTAVLRLMWRSGAAEPDVIPERYFFTSNAAPTVKFSGVDPKVFDSAFLHNGVQPFVDNKSHFIADVPLRYHGRRMLRSLAQPNIESFSVDLNVPAVLFVASLADEPLPLEPTKEKPWTVHDTHETMTLLSGVDASGRALEARSLHIRFISLRTAESVFFKVARTAAPFILFVEPRREEAFSCDAEEDVVSLVGGPAYAECNATSEKPGGFDCSSGLNGKHMDRIFGTWKTKGQGVGESISVRFRHLVQITHFRFKPLDDQLLWPSEITLSYSEQGEEESETFHMKHSNSLELNTYKLKASTITQYVKAEISQMYINGLESGGSFEFLGSICTTQAKAEGVSSLRKILIEKCDQSLNMIPEVVPLQEGFQFIAICPHHCVSSPEGRVYGSSTFAPDSTVCTSGVFAGLCSAAFEVECSLLVSVGGAKIKFNKGEAADIEALSHGPSDASFTLAKAPCDAPEEDQPAYYFTFGSTSGPEGWLVDDGSPRHVKNGTEYGWLRPAPISVSRDATERLTTSGVVFPSPSLHTCQLGEDCTPNFWVLVVPRNGLYQLELLAATPFDSPYSSAPIYLQANGVVLANGNIIPKGKVFGGSAIVEVKEQLVDVASVCTNAACGGEPTMLLSASVFYLGPFPGSSPEHIDE